MKATEFSILTQRICSLSEQIIQLQAESDKHFQDIDHCKQKTENLSQQICDNIQQYNDVLHQHLQVTGRQNSFPFLKVPPLFRIGDLLIDTSEGGHAHLVTVPELQNCSPTSN